MQLKTYLHEANIPISACAAAIGQSESAVKKYVRRERIPRRAAMIRIEEWSGGKVTPADWYASDDADPKPANSGSEAA